MLQYDYGLLSTFMLPSPSIAIFMTWCRQTCKLSDNSVEKRLTKFVKNDDPQYSYINSSLSFSLLAKHIHLASQFPSNSGLEKPSWL